VKPVGHPINLVSRQASSTRISGPGKVFRNLVKGLDRIGQSYVVNRALDSTRRLWVHDNLHALLELPRHGTGNVLGPNLVVLPRDLPTRQPFCNSLYLHPSPWAVGIWIEEGFAQCPLRAWPVGIDTDDFPRRTKPQGGSPVLIYFKKRFPEELSKVCRALAEQQMPYRILQYGTYAEPEYLAALRDCSFVVWLGGTESQGIALQEALACNVPVLVLDALSLFQHYPPEAPRRLFPDRLRTFRTTSAPYFEARCGLKVDSMEALPPALSAMRDRLDAFRPREFVLETLSLEKQAGEFVSFFEELESASNPSPGAMRLGQGGPYVPRRVTRMRMLARRVTGRLRNTWRSRMRPA